MVRAGKLPDVIVRPPEPPLWQPKQPAPCNAVRAAFSCAICTGVTGGMAVPLPLGHAPDEVQ